LSDKANFGRVQGYLILVPIKACTKHSFGLCGPDGSQ